MDDQKTNDFDEEESSNLWSKSDEEELNNLFDEILLGESDQAHSNSIKKANDFESQIERKRADIQNIISELQSLSIDDKFFERKRYDLENKRRRLIDELSDLEHEQENSPVTDSSPDETQDEPELQTTDDSQNTAATDIQPKVVDVVATPSPDQLLNSLSAIYFKAGSGQYDESERRKFLSISFALTDAGEHNEPFFRHFGANFEGQACKQDRTGRLSDYMQDLQIADLYYMWRWHRGLKSVGKFEGIFEGDEFNLELAKKIAAIKISAGGKNNGKGGKVDDNALCLNRDMQRKLIVLRDDAARQWQADKRRANIKLDNRKMEIERRLKDYVKGNSKARMTDEQARTHSIVWWAMKIAKGVQKEACKIYEQRTGEAICRQLLNKKFNKVSKIAPDLCNPSRYL